MYDTAFAFHGIINGLMFLYAYFYKLKEIKFQIVNEISSNETRKYRKLVKHGQRFE